MILQESSQNKKKSAIIIVLFFIFITLLSSVLCYAFFIDNIYVSLISSIGVSLLLTCIAYKNCSTMILTMSNAILATDEKYNELNNLLENMSIASGLPKPKLYVIEDKALNAFATGRNSKEAIICFTTGLINKLDKYELEGVMAHEMSHIKNNDILLATIASVFVGFVLMLADFMRYKIIFSDNNDSENKSKNILRIIAIILLIISPIFAILMQMALSRRREFLADSTAIELTRNPEGLKNALIKLRDDTSTLKSQNRATAPLYISNPFKGKNLFSTHPPIEDRIKALEHIN